MSRGAALALIVAGATACHTPHGEPQGADAPLVAADATSPLADSATPPLSAQERCGDGIDNDGDGLVDEDCAPSLFAGVYAPGVAADPALAALEGAAAGPALSVLQTYHSTSAAGVARIAPDLAAIFARGQVAHLNIEPAGYTKAQYAAPTQAPVANDLQAMAAAVTSALAAAPHGRIILTFGAEMNGNWTDWGCLSAPQYVALYRAAHDAVTAALAAHQLDARRVRWAYGPNATSSTSCGSAAGYFPGVDYADLLGMSAYRSGSASVDAAVYTPMAQLFDALGWPDAWRRERFVVLQTGSRDVAGDADRSAWARELFATGTADPRVAGVIWFDAADWAVPTDGAGWTGLTQAIAAAPVADRGLDAIFEPRFWDVAYSDPAFPEIQALATAGITSGCAATPARFCPDAPVARADAMALLSRAFPAGDPALPDGDSVSEADLEDAITALGGAPAGDPVSSAPATRARAALLIARGARL